MNTKHFALLCASLFLLSCAPAASSTTTSSIDTPSSSIAESSSQSIESISSSKEESSSSKTQSKPTLNDAVYDFYCINDFHGSIVEQYNGSYYEAGISKLFGKLKELKDNDPEHTFIFSAGDMYQGSLESNSNYGELVTLAMNHVGFDAMTLGNHEFDYGQEKLLENIARAEFPILGGNIKRYDKNGSTEQWNEDIVPSTIIERGGNKIGVVGMIGYGQTTSICSSYVQDIDFVSPNKLAKNEAKRLRDEEGCGVVIYILHDDMNTCMSYAADKKYFDGVFTGHNHTINDELISGVPFEQAYCNGEAISHFQLTITDNVVKCTNNEIIRANPEWEENEEISAIRDSFIQTPEFEAKANAVAGTIQGTLSKGEGVPNVAVKAMYEKYTQLHPDIVLAMENSQRASLSGTVTYHDIYKATPFMNKIVIARVLGREIINEAKYNSVYCGENTSLESTELYTIACTDYVLLHQNEQKSYNYFSSLNYDFEEKIVAEYEDYPFDLTFNYIKNDCGGSINANDYLKTCPGFSVSYA